MQFPIVIGLRRSRFLDCFVFLGTVLASLSVVALPQIIFVQAALLLALWICGALAWWQLAPRCAAIRLERSGQVGIARLGSNEFLVVDLLPGGTVHPWLTVIRWKDDKEKVATLALAGDSMNTDDFRRLRVFLRWQADFSATNDGA